jgi:hypothetical protein
MWVNSGSGSVPLATKVLAGKVQIGDGIAVSSGVISAAVDGSSIELSGTAPNKTLNVRAGGVTNAMLAGSIADTNLSTISTANKVSGSAVQLKTSVSRLKDSTGLMVDFTKSLTNDNAGTISIRQVVYIKSNGNVDLAQATTVNLDKAKLGLVADATILTTAPGLITCVSGAVIPGFTGLTKGAPVYVSEATAGAMVQDFSAFSAGSLVYRIGYAFSDTEIELNPEFEFEF